MPVLVLIFAALALLSPGKAQEAQTVPGQSASIDSPTNESLAIPIVPGRLVHQIKPKYPKDPPGTNISGKVVLETRIDPDGSVIYVSVISGDLLLAEEAIDAVLDWKFEPYTENGAPIQVAQDIAFDFIAGKKDAEMEPLPPSVPVLTAAAKQVISNDPGVYRVGHGVSAPKAVYTPDPEYTEKARKAKYQGVCVLSLIVGEDGLPRDIRVVRALGNGLDIKAVEAVKRWRFEPATKEGKPVAVAVKVEVNFRLR